MWLLLPSIRKWQGSTDRRMDRKCTEEARASVMGQERGFSIQFNWSAYGWEPSLSRSETSFSKARLAAVLMRL